MNGRVNHSADQAINSEMTPDRLNGRSGGEEEMLQEQKKAENATGKTDRKELQETMHVHQECANPAMHVLTEKASHSENQPVNLMVIQDHRIKISNQKRDRKELQEKTHLHQEFANRVMLVLMTESANHIESPRAGLAMTPARPDDHSGREELQGKGLPFQEMLVRKTERKNGIAKLTVNFTVTKEKQHRADEVSIKSRESAIPLRLVVRPMTDSFASTNSFPMQAFVPGEKQMR
jgi:hypothetical protein